MYVRDAIMRGISLADGFGGLVSWYNARKLFCPWAINPGRPMATKGMYTAGYPAGAVIHYTAGQHGMSAYETALKREYTYFLIDLDGKVYQGFSLDRWGWHVGQSYHKRLGKSLNSKLVGIEITSAGKLDAIKTEYRSWWGDAIEDSKVRHVKGEYYQNSGFYEAYSTEQEKSLVRLLIWLSLNNPHVFKPYNVFGHDELSIGKTDPGGCLSVPVPTLRLFLDHAHRKMLADKPSA
jgi:hypothetical protein